RQDVTINGASVGTPPFFPARRLMDGDPTTISSDGSTGICAPCSNQSEWVFFAMTYQVLIPGVNAHLQMYGMSQSEAGTGLQLIDDVSGYFGDAVNISGGQAAILGNTGFGAGTVNRPADEAFDALAIDARVLSFNELSARAASIINPIPEPTTACLAVLSGMGWIVVAARKRKRDG